jgi:hypothetical protein
MKPNQAQIDAGVAEAKLMISQADIPAFIADQITDDRVTAAVTQVLDAAFAVPGDAA